MADLLRIESAQGEPRADYRVRKGHVELRDWQSEPGTSGRSWRRLSAAELRHHLAQSPALEYWVRAQGVLAPTRSASRQDAA